MPAVSYYTDRGLALLQRWALRSQTDTPPENIFVALVKATPAPSKATKLLSELGEIAVGSGYVSGGQAVTCDDVGFPDFTEDDIGFLADLIMREVTFLPTGGPIPASGTGPAFAVWLSDEATPADRQVILVLDLDGEQIRPAGIPLLVNGVSRGEQPA